jgi:ABC-type branched-subunit amino acid transport system ATPase component
MNTLLELTNITKSFDGIKAVNNLSLAIERETITSLIGPNGAGKTTLFNIITAFTSPDKGSVYFKDEEITNLMPHDIVKIGIVRSFQDLRLFQKMTVLDNVLVAIQNQYGDKFFDAAFGCKKRRTAQDNNKLKASKYLEFFNLSDKINIFAEDLSYGEQKLLSMARLLASEAELFLLDEPVSGLHPEEIKIIIQKIKELVKQGKTILLVEHNMEAVMEISDKVIVLDEGKVIASGRPDEIQGNKEVIEVYLGT